MGKLPRLRDFDYSQAGAYFVTVCAADRFDGENGPFGAFRRVSFDRSVFVQNDVGEIASDCWMAIPAHFPTVMIGEFALMPNHVHGILFFTAAPGASRPVLGTVIGSFKSAVSRTSASYRPPGRLWQRGFHDRIVRDAEALDAIQQYIATNALRHSAPV